MQLVVLRCMSKQSARNCRRQLTNKKALEWSAITCRWCWLYKKTKQCHWLFGGDLMRAEQSRICTLYLHGRVDRMQWRRQLSQRNRANSRAWGFTTGPPLPSSGGPGVLPPEKFWVFTLLLASFSVFEARNVALPIFPHSLYTPIWFFC